MIGATAGSAVLMQTMQGLGVLAESTYQGPLQLQGGGNGTKILILGAGLAGMTAALELSKQGYECEILEFNDRAGGRVWSVRRGTRFEELGGEVQYVNFDEGEYFNPGPWRVPSPSPNTSVMPSTPGAAGSSASISGASCASAREIITRAYCWL